MGISRYYDWGAHFRLRRPDDHGRRRARCGKDLRSAKAADRRLSQGRRALRPASQVQDRAAHYVGRVPGEGGPRVPRAHVQNRQPIRLVRGEGSRWRETGLAVHGLLLRADPDAADQEHHVRRPLPDRAGRGHYRPGIAALHVVSPTRVLRAHPGHRLDHPRAGGRGRQRRAPRASAARVPARQRPLDGQPLFSLAGHSQAAAVRQALVYGFRRP